VHLTVHTLMRILRRMATKLKITGAIDRAEPDPAAPSNLMVRWIGSLAVEWIIDGRPRSAASAILRFDTGGGWLVDLWGVQHLALRWHGDQPDPEIARAVYEALLHRGPSRGQFVLDVESSSSTSLAAPAYRALRAPAALTSAR
jgi:hypothetical protein